MLSADATLSKLLYHFLQPRSVCVVYVFLLHVELLYYLHLKNFAYVNTWHMRIFVKSYKITWNVKFKCVSFFPLIRCSSFKNKMYTQSTILTEAQSILATATPTNNWPGEVCNGTPWFILTFNFKSLNKCTLKVPIHSLCKRVRSFFSICCLSLTVSAYNGFFLWLWFVIHLYTCLKYVLWVVKCYQRIKRTEKIQLNRMHTPKTHKTQTQHS